MKNIRSGVMTAAIILTVITLAVMPAIFGGKTAGVAAYAFEIEYTPGYGYDSMTSDMKEVYDDMVNDIETMLTLGTDVTSEKREYEGVYYRSTGLSYMSADYGGISVSDLKAVYTSLKMLHPEYYFLPNVLLVYGDSKPGLELVIIDEYASSEAREETDNRIERVKSDILSDVPDGAAASEIARIVYGRICSYMSYAYDGAGAPSLDHKAHSIIGALPENASAVCEGISKWFSYLLLEEGVENYIVTGYSGTSGIPESQGANHSWNVVKLEDGKWYDFDLTWDINYRDKYGFVSYQYFAISDDDFKQDHYRERTAYDDVYLYDVPEAENSYLYNVYAVQTSGLNFADRNAFTALYTKMFEAALDAGDRYIVIYVGNMVNSALARSYVSSLTVNRQVQKNVTADGYPDKISYKGTATMQNEKFLCVLISSSMYCEKAMRHSFTEQDPVAANLASAATCASRARYYYVCEYCGFQGDETYEYGDYSNTHKLSGTAAKPATCTGDGNIAYWYCSVCKKYFDSKDAAHSISLSETVVNALGHSYVCDGYDENAHRLICTVCKDSVTQAHEFELSGESTEGRYTTITYACALCGCTKSDVVDNCAKGHTYTGWQIFEEGHRRVCSVCGETAGIEDHTLAAVGEDGRKITYRCTECGFTTVREKDVSTVSGGETGAPPVTTGPDVPGGDPAQHFHSYGERLPYNETSHIRYCECGESVIEEHVWIVTGAVTEGDTRTMTYMCQECGYEKTETEILQSGSGDHVFRAVAFAVSVVTAVGAVAGLAVAVNMRRKRRQDG